MRSLLVVGVLWTMAGCAWRMDAGAMPMHAAPAPGPAPHGPMSYDEAVHLGSRYAESRGLAYRLEEAKLDDKRVWKVRFDVRRQDARGHLKLRYDAHSRALLKADEKLKGKKDDKHDDGDHDDHDDDDDRKRRNKKKDD